MTEKKTITFRLKCNPRIEVTAPAGLVVTGKEGFGIIFWNEEGHRQAIVLPNDIWGKE